MRAASNGREGLRSMQTWFLDVITRLDFPDADAQAPDDRDRLQQIEHRVKSGHTESSSTRLAIYQQSYFSRVVECLGDDYPALRFALGQEAFTDLCHAYTMEFPSRSPSLNFYGRNLAGFVRGRGGQSAPFASELARLEWGLVQAVHAPSSGAFDAADLRAVPPERLPTLCFVPNPSLLLFDFEYPVNTFLQAFLSDESPVLPRPRSSFVAVVRQGHSLWRFDLGAVQASLLRRVVASEPLGLALRDVEASQPEVQQWFSDWAKCGLLVDFTLGGV